MEAWNDKPQLRQSDCLRVACFYALFVVIFIVCMACCLAGVLAG